jgi:hypothetical protein
MHHNVCCITGDNRTGFEIQFNHYYPLEAIASP